MSVIKTENLSYTYNEGTDNEVKAVDNVNVSIENGDIVGIIGKTGSGKSTFVQMLNGLIKPSCGAVYVNGRNICDKSFDRKKLCFEVGLVFQYPEYQLFENTVYDDIAFGPKNKGLNGENLKNAVTEAVKFVNIDESLLEKSPFELSGGQKRRVAIAGIIAMNPSVLVFDEPTAGLDPLAHEQLINSILSYHRQKNATIIFISHVMEDIAMISNKVMVFDKGRVCMFDNPKKVFSRKNELSKIGLSVPSITEIMEKIKLKGHNVATDIVTVDEGENELLSLFKERKI